MSAGEVESLLADRPELEAPLEDVRAVDARAGTWTFDDVPVDSGAFGELVAAGIVESVGDEYRLADPEAVDRALAGEERGPDPGSRGFEFDVPLPAVDRTAAGALAAVLVLLALLRASTYRSVMRDRVVYTGNDPYAYVYFVEEGLREGWSLSEIPVGRANQEPLTTVQLLYAAELSGGLGSHGPILAWIPVIVAVLTGVVLYLLVCEITGDRRVALAAVFALAVIPIHATRSSLGFVDHHVFDYFWLVVAAWGLTAAFRLETLGVDRATVRAVGLLALGVAGGVLAWWAGTLLLAPIGIAVVVGCAVAVRDDEPFWAPGVATTVGVGLGAAVVLAAHLRLGWHDPLIVAVPIALFVGSALVVAATAAWRYAALPPWLFLVMGPALVVVATVGVRVAAPELWPELERELLRLFGVGFEDTVEFHSIFSTETMGWLFLFGLLLLFSIPYMAWGGYRVYNGERRWIPVTAYGGFMLVLATLLQRFGGELSPFVAVFAGVGLVHVAAWVDLARPIGESTGENLSLPDRRTTLRLSLVVLLICGLSLLGAPIMANNIAFDDEQYGTAVAIGEHAAAHDHDYPESYVFSPWSWNRMYNYHVSGESRSYGYARSNFGAFRAAEDPDAARELLRRGTSGEYVVTEPTEAAYPPESMQVRLHENFGSYDDGVDGLAHYRAIHASESGDYKAFRVVPGANVTGGADPGETVRLETGVDVSGASFTYERRVTADDDGSFAVRLAHPGEYAVDGADVDAVTVAEDDVVEGNRVEAS